MDLNSLSPYVRVAMYSHCSKPWFMPTRCIFDYELILIEEGEWDLVYNEVYYHCRHNDILLFIPGSTQQIYVHKDVDVSQPHIHFDMIYDADSPRVYIPYKTIDRFTPEERRLIRKDLLEEFHVVSPIWHAPDIKEFKRRLFDIIDTFTAKPPQYELICKIQLLSLLQYLLKEVLISAPESPPSHQRLDMVKNYLDSSAEVPLTLESIARYFGYNACYLDRQFKQTYGVSIIQYHRAVRAQLAAMNLLQGHSVSQISTELHFSSLYAFSRYFKQQLQLSPRAFLAAQKTLSNEKRLEP